MSNLIVERVCEDHAGGHVRVYRPGGAPCPLCMAYVAEEELVARLKFAKAAYKSLAGDVMQVVGILESLAYVAAPENVAPLRDAASKLASSVEENEPEPGCP